MVLVFSLLFLLLIPITGRAASTETHINLDGRELNLSGDNNVRVSNKSVMVPLRLVAQEMGYSVEYANKTKKITIKQSGTVLQLTIGQKTAQVNGEQVTLLAAPQLSGSNSSAQVTFVPLRFVGEQTGAEVSWDNKTKTAYIISASQGGDETVLPGAGSASGNNSDPIPVPDSQAPDSGADTGQNGTSGSVNPPEASIPSATLSNLSFLDNQLVLAINGNVTPKVFTMTQNDRIVIDLANTAFAADFGGGELSFDAKQSGTLPVQGYPGVTDVRYALFSSDPSTVRIVLDLTAPKAYRLMNNNDGLITIDLNTTGQAGDGTMPVSGSKTIVIDAGHGGKDPGAPSYHKRYEKEFNLATALKVQQLLENEPGIQVVMTRESDVYPTLQDRVNLANQLKADVFVSIHGNKSPDGGTGPNGVETHYTKTNSYSLATIMQKYLLQSSGLKDRGLKKDNLFVNKNTTMPAVLLECGFLSNPTDEAAMFSDSYQQQVAEGIVAGLKEFLGLS